MAKMSALIFCLHSFQEIVRVLKPGGSLEIIEEDILFPSPDTPVTKTPRASPTLRGRMKRSQSRSTYETVPSEEEEESKENSEENGPSEKSRSIDTISGGQQDQVRARIFLTRK